MIQIQVFLAEDSQRRCDSGKGRIMKPKASKNTSVAADPHTATVWCKEPQTNKAQAEANEKQHHFEGCEASYVGG